MESTLKKFTGKSLNLSLECVVRGLIIMRSTIEATKAHRAYIGKRPLKSFKLNKLLPGTFISVIQNYQQ